MVSANGKGQGIIGEAMLLLAVFSGMVCWGGSASFASSYPRQAALDVLGSGAAPLSQISLSTGKNQVLTTKSDKKGDFSFFSLGFSPGIPLTFQMNVPQTLERGKADLNNSLSFTIDPMGGATTLKGDVAKAASVVVNLGGTDPGSAVANEKGKFEILTLSREKLAKGKGMLIASIVNVQETCCPRNFVPLPPLTISVSSSTVAAAPAAKKNISPAPNVAPPPFIIPVPEQGNPAKKDKDKNRNKEKNKEENHPDVPYIIRGSVTHGGTIQSAPLSFGVSFPDTMYQATWVGGFKKFTDQAIKNAATNAKMRGTFLDGQNAMSAMRELEKANLNSTLKYQPSMGVCRFGSAGASLAAADASALANKMAFNEILRDTQTQVKNTVFAKTAAEGRSALLNDFQRKYCRSIDNNNGLKSFCKGLGAADTRFNHDVDYTRVFDAPLTVPVNFTNGAKTPEEEDVIAIFRNLSIAGTLPEIAQNAFPEGGADEMIAEDLRAAIAAHGVAQNTFADIVGQKAEGGSAASGKLKETIQHLGLSAADAEKHIGNKPSYYAQMEILAKKTYQDPAFVANLYESPENVKRQRSAIKATSLQQGYDLYQSLKRREMLLSALLELKLREKARQENQSGVAAK